MKALEMAGPCKSRIIEVPDLVLSAGQLSVKVKILI